MKITITFKSTFDVTLIGCCCMSCGLLPAIDDHRMIVTATPSEFESLQDMIADKLPPVKDGKARVEFSVGRQ